MKPARPYSKDRAFQVEGPQGQRVRGQSAKHERGVLDLICISRITFLEGVLESQCNTPPGDTRVCRLPTVVCECVYVCVVCGCGSGEVACVPGQMAGFSMGSSSWREKSRVERG